MFDRVRLGLTFSFKSVIFQAERDNMPEQGRHERLTGETVEERDSSQLKIVRSDLAEHVRVRDGLLLNDIVIEGDVTEPKKLTSIAEVAQLLEGPETKVVDINSRSRHKESKTALDILRERNIKKAA